MNVHGKDIKLFEGHSNQELAEKIAERIGLPISKATLDTFSDGEIEVHINEAVRGSDVFVIQSTSPPVNENLMELLIMIDALKRSSAGRITAVMPYFGYARQDRKSKARDPITAKLVANLLTTAGADRILTMDFHASQLQGFFDIPVDHLMGGPILARYYKKIIKNTEELVAVAPDVGSVRRVRKFAEHLEIPIAIIDKRRPKANMCQVMNIIGDVNNKRVILLDDLIDTGGSIVNAANALAEAGTKEVLACCTHAVLSGDAVSRIEKSAIKELVTLNTITISKDKKIDKIKQLSVAEVFAETIERIYGDISISTLFTQHDD
jgi:ribose-phosphate pyrophosphokinase